jgi:hypothetical protein
MSILKVENIQHPSSSTPAISLHSDGTMTGSFPYPNRNLLYNGAMQVAQRGTSTASITANGYHTADRWITWLTTLGTWTQSVENDAPTGSGLRKSLKMLCTTADAAPSASDQLSIRQLLEGQDLQRIAKGTASAQQLTLSFWVKSNVTGTYIVEAFDGDNGRQVSASYTISASATWEKKTITLPADTTGAFDNDNAASLILLWWLSSGSNFTSGTLNTTWDTATNANRAVGQTNLAANTNNYWQITGLQLETGPVATEFEFEPYGTTLAKCQRYYYSVSNYGYIATQFTNGRIDVIVDFPTTMRSSPTYSKVNAVGVNDGYAVAGASTSTQIALLLNGSSPDRALLYATGLIGSAGQGGHGTINNSLQFSSEL